MNSQDRVIILGKVKEELQKGNDYLSHEFLINKKITNDEDRETINCLKYLMKRIPKENQVGFQSWLKSADPFVVAYTLRISKFFDEKVILIHGEVERGKKIRIPYVCRLLGIESGGMSKIIIEEKIKFKII